MSAQTVALFLGVTLTLLVVPGPSALFAFTRSMQQGPRAGMCAVAGLETGLLVHVLAATLGVSGLVASSPAALQVLRLGGAAYLALLGLRGLLRASSVPVSAPHLVHPAVRLFRDGLVIDVLNPKTLLFFLALLPQFVDPEQGPVGRQSLLLGLTVVALAWACDSGYVLAGWLLRRRQVVPGLSPRMERAAATAFLGLAALAVAG